jgi:hypothetical protein
VSHAFLKKSGHLDDADRLEARAKQIRQKHAEQETAAMAEAMVR